MGLLVTLLGCMVSYHTHIECSACISHQMQHMHLPTAPLKAVTVEHAG